MRRSLQKKHLGLVQVDRKCCYSSASRHFWPKIKKAEFCICDDVRLEKNLKPLKEEAITFCSNILQIQDNSTYLPREDYKELLTLNLIFLGGIPPPLGCVSVFQELV